MLSNIFGGAVWLFIRPVGWDPSVPRVSSKKFSKWLFVQY